MAANAELSSATVDHIIGLLDNVDFSLSSYKSRCKNAVKILRVSACEIGLSQQQLWSVCKLATNYKFGYLGVDLVHCLMPRESVPEDIALHIISKICQDKLDIKVENFLFRWLVLVFDLIATKTRLHCIYRMIFHYVESDILCPAVCQLLFLLTRKSDVSHYRISKLLELQRRVGPQPHICGLLSVYRMYQPSLISMSGGFTVFFKKVDKRWGQSIQNIQQKYGISMLNEALGIQFSKQKDKKELIHGPLLNMAHTEEQYLPLANHLSGKVPLHQIKSFQKLLDNFSQLDLSCQAFTLLSSPVLQLILAVTSDRTIALRLSFWLHGSLLEEVLSSTGESEMGSQLLNVMLQLAGFIQECLPVCEAFLFRYLCTWNGYDYRSYILKLVGGLKIRPFPVLHGLVLSPLRELFMLSSNVYFKCSIINAMSGLLTNFLTLEAPKQEEMLKLADMEGSELIEKFKYTLHPCKTDVFDVNSTIDRLIRFVVEMCVEGLLVEKNNLLLVYYTLQFHKQVSSIYKKHKRPIIVTPSAVLVSITLFSMSAPCISLLCDILLRQRKAIAKLKRDGLLEESFQSEVNCLNQRCIDVYDTIWRRKAFKPFCSDDTCFYESLGKGIVTGLLSHPNLLSARRMFCLDRHPAFVSYINEYTGLFGIPPNERLEAEFVTEKEFIEFLESKGLMDITSFLEDLRSK